RARRPNRGIARSPRSRAELDVRRSLPRGAVRSVGRHVHRDRQQHDADSRPTARPHGTADAGGLHAGGEAADRQALPAAAPAQGDGIRERRERWAGTHRGRLAGAADRRVHARSGRPPARARNPGRTEESRVGGCGGRCEDGEGLVEKPGEVRRPAEGPKRSGGPGSAWIRCRGPARQEVAMTGELTLRGRGLPIGGLKEKLTAAARSGVTSVLVPERNKNDLIDLPEEVRKLLDIKLVETIDDVLELALLDAPPADERRRSGGIRIVTPPPPASAPPGPPVPPPPPGEARR